MENRGPEEAVIHLLPTLWFRNMWAWGLPGADAVPEIHAIGARLLAGQDFTLSYRGQEAIGH